MPPPPTGPPCTPPPTPMSGSTSSRKRGKGSTAQIFEEQAPRHQKKKTLQEEHERNQRVEKELVEVFEDKEGLAGVKYKCRTCGLIKMCKLRCVSHAVICGKKARRKVYRRGKGRKLLPCNICGHQETSRDRLLKHRQREHRSLMRKPRCWQCNISFSSSKSYRVHALSHQTRKVRFTCTVEGCQEKFSTAGNMRRHRVGHLRESAKLRLQGWQRVNQNIEDFMKSIEDQGAHWGFTKKQVERILDVMRSKIISPVTTNQASKCSPLSQAGPSSVPISTSSSFSENISTEDISTQITETSLSEAVTERAAEPSKVGLRPRMATSSPATSPVPIRLFSGTSMLALPPHRSYRLLADSPQGVEASTQTKPRPKVRHCRALKQKNFNCEVCQKAFRDNYALKEHVKKVHSPAMVEEGGIVCERWFCDMRLPTKYDWQQHMKECFWLCPDPACGNTRLTKHRDIERHTRGHERRNQMMERLSRAP